MTPLAKADSFDLLAGGPLPPASPYPTSPPLMLRRRAVRDLLFEEVAGVRISGPDDETSLPLAEREELERELDGDRLEELQKAERRSLLVALFDWAAIVVLFLFREDAVPFMPLEGGVEDVLSFGLLAVAVHSGLRLGDWGRYRAVRRALDRLD